MRQHQEHWQEAMSAKSTLGGAFGPSLPRRHIMDPNLNRIRADRLLRLFELGAGVLGGLMFAMGIGCYVAAAPRGGEPWDGPLALAGCLLVISGTSLALYVLSMLESEEL